MLCVLGVLSVLSVLSVLCVLGVLSVLCVLCVLSVLCVLCVLCLLGVDLGCIVTYCSKGEELKCCHYGMKIILFLISIVRA